MRVKEQATAGPLFSADSSSGESSQPAYASPQEEARAEPPPKPNAFTPISVAERLRQPPRRSAHHQSPLPPMQPGQRYSYGSPASQEAEEVRQYQQDYWSQLQNQPLATARLQESPAPAPPMIPDYLREQAALPPTAPRTLWDEGFPHQPQEEEAPEEWPPRPWELEGRATEEWQPEDVVYAAFGEEKPGDSLWESQEWQPLPDASAPEIPREIPGGPRREAPPSRLLGMLRKAFALSPNPDMTKARLFQTAAASLLSLMLIFCLLQVGRIVLSLLQNDEEMKAVRESYYAQAGVELAWDAARVELLPYGVTFAPTATPQPRETAPPAPPGSPEGSALVGASAGGEGQAPVPEDPAPTVSRRTKATQYPDNPLNNVMEAFVNLRAENPDIVGRLTIDGLVDETVVMRNNTYYLTHNANGSFSETGAVFVDESCGLKSPPENLLLRGQSTAQGKLLEPLWNYCSQGADFVRQHAFLQMDTLYEEGQYVLFAVIVTGNRVASPGYFNYAGYPSFPSDGEMESYVATAKALSLYEIPVEVWPTDRLLTLSTLGDSGGDTLVLIARKLRQGETATSHLLKLQSVRAK